MRFGFLLRPGWLALTATVIVFSVACFTLLSPWQFSRNAERAQQNAALVHAMSAKPQPLTRLLPDDRPPDTKTEWMPVAITGRYLPDDEVVARLRTVQGEPAFEILTPLRTSDGDVVLVDRGYVAPGDKSQVPPYAAPPAGTVTVVARARVDEPDLDGKRPDHIPGTKPQVYGVSAKIAEQATGVRMRDGYFQLTPRQPGVLNALPLPQVDSGPFLSYALQWIAFGTMALLGWAYFTIREARPGGVLYETKRKSVAQILAEDEAAEAAELREQTRPTTRA